MLIGIADLVARSFTLYKQHLKTILLFVLLNLAPTALLFLTIFVVGIVAGGAALVTGGIGSMSIVAGIFGIIGFVISIILGIWIQSAFMRSVAHIEQTGQAPSIGEAMRDAKPVIWKAFAAPLLSSIIAAWPLFVIMLIGSGSVLILRDGAGTFARIIQITCVIAILPACVYAFITSIKLFFSISGATIDGLAPREAIRHSRMLVQGRWGAIFVRLIGSTLLICCIVIGVSMIFSVFEGVTARLPIVSLLFTILNLIAQTLIMQAFVIVQVVLYAEAKKTVSLAPPAPIKIA